jgi:hypothetical protein
MNDRANVAIKFSPLLKTSTFAAGCLTSIVCSSSIALAVPIDRYFTVQPIQVCNNAGASCAPTPIFQSEIEKIYRQAGVASIFLPTTQLNNTSLLQTTGIAAINQPGNGRSPNSTTVNTWFVDNLNTTPGSILYGQAYVGGNGVVINGTAVQNFNNGNGRRDTLAHEIGHNLGLEHDTFGAGGGNNLLTAGNSRSVPDGVGNITPSGSDLSQLTAEQIAKIRTSPLLNQVPEVIIDTNGSTPFNTNNFFLVDFKKGPANVFLQSLTVDLAPVKAFFDSTNAPPGLSGSPFGVANLNGINASDITLVGGNDALNGKQQLTLNFAPNSFAQGDSLRFGLDIDLFSNIDAFGATPQELIGSLFSFKFSDGFGAQSAIGSDLIASSLDPLSFLSFTGQPSGGLPIAPGTIIDTPDPDPIATAVPEPSNSITMLALGLGILGKKVWKRRSQLASNFIATAK